MDAIDRVPLGTGLEQLKCRREQVNKRRARFRCGLSRGFGIGSQIRIQFSPIRKIPIASVLISNGAEQNKPNVLSLLPSQFAIPLNQFHQFGSIGIRAARSRKGLVVSVETEHDIRPDVLQVLGIVGETLIAGSLVDHVSRKAHVAETDVHALQLALQNRFDPRVMLHSVGQTIAVNGDHIIWLES